MRAGLELTLWLPSASFRGPSNCISPCQSRQDCLRNFSHYSSPWVETDSSHQDMLLPLLQQSWDPAEGTPVSLDLLSDSGGP